MNDDILRVEGEISKLEAEWRDIYAKAALFDVLAARIEAGAWTISDGVDCVTIAIRRTGERVHGATLAEAVEKAMEAEGGGK